MTKYARLKKDRKFLNWTMRCSHVVFIPSGTIVEVTTHLLLINSIQSHRLYCGEAMSIISINEADEWLEFLND